MLPHLPTLPLLSRWFLTLAFTGNHAMTVPVNRMLLYLPTIFLLAG